MLSAGEGVHASSNVSDAGGPVVGRSWLHPLWKIPSGKSQYQKTSCPKRNSVLPNETHRRDYQQESGARWLKWLEREFTDRKVRGSNPTSASRLHLPRLGQPRSITALVLPLGGMGARHRKGAKAEQQGPLQP
ncbi:hypothetical protein CSKR_101342 [Clonorchis sinensis]|uniref:Uncharacterized protein n=1 Tax=Clonorchis sinensis TaxID=79923 RepID=A0A3R7JZX9_CLOSI|nr:hypothetical protein CSKR_101342 [Clonorchis sinensis]